MYSLMIVDDEYQARVGLRDLVPWNDLGIRVTADADDGESALALLEEARPDILLTDVRMNRMDGIELAHEVRRRMPDTCIVFISGYAEADYLREALHIGAVDYIYKPIRIAELVKTMQHVVERLDSRRQLRDQQEQMRLLVQKSKPLLVERFLHSWFSGLMEDASEIESRLELLGLRFPLNEPVVAAFCQLQWSAFPNPGEVETCQLLLEQAIHKRLAAALFCAWDTGVALLIPAGSDTREALCEPLAALAADLRASVAANLLVGVSRVYPGGMDARTAMKEAQQTAACQLAPSDQVLFFYEEPSRGERESAAPLDMELWERYLLSGGYDMAERLLSDALDRLPSSMQGAMQARKLLMSTSLRMDLLLEREGLEGVDSLGYCARAMKSPSIPAMRREHLCALRTACEAMARQRGRTYSALVNRVLELIHTRYAERLSIDDISEAMHYSSAHLSTLFRAETGITLGDALLRTRMKAAMDQLADTLDPVSTIAQQCGYADVQYFSRVFKRFTGQTPLEYRRKASRC